MKKFALLCCGIFLGTSTLFAAPDAKQLEYAVNNYKQNQIEGLCIGLKLRGVTVTNQMKQQIAALSDEFTKNTVLPLLAKHRLTETWIKCQLDPELGKLYAKTLTITDEKELREVIKSIIDMMNKEYPILVNTVFADPEYQAGFRKLLVGLKSTIGIPEKK